MRNWKQQLWSLLLCGAMLTSMFPLSALAAEAEANTGGLCPHHQEHTEDCGFIEAVEGQLCGHIHDGDCGFVEAVPEIPCEMDCAGTGEDGQIIHGEGCGYVPEVEGVPCQHEHDGGCGYAEAVEGQPCGYVCPVCPVQALIDALPAPEDITEGNAEEVGVQFDAVHAEILALMEQSGAADPSELLTLDRYHAAEDALSALAGTPVPEVPLSLSTQAEGTAITDTSTEADIRTAFGSESIAVSSNTITLADDIALSSPVVFASGTWVLTLSDHTLSGAKDAAAIQLIGGELTVNSVPYPKSPTAPQIQSVTADTITIQEVSGQKYKLGDNGIWQSSGIFTGLSAATKYKICTYRPATDSSFATNESSKEFYTAKATPTPGTGYTVDYRNETLEITDGYEVNTMQDFSGMSISSGGKIDPGTTCYIRAQASTGDSNLNIPASAAISITLDSRPAAPSVQGYNESVTGQNDGRITGTTTDMEYSTDGTNWTDCTDTATTGLAPGNYKVRLKATYTAFVGAEADVEIKSGAAPTYTLDVTAPTFTAITYGDAQPTAQAITIRNIGNSDATISSVTVSGSDFTIGGNGSTVTVGSSIISWTVQPNDGLSAGEHTATIIVAYNDGAEATTDVKFKVIGAPQAAPTNAPVEKSKTYNSVTLETVANNANGAAAEYSIDGGSTWQASPVFNDLSPNTAYTFVVRYKAIDSYLASDLSDPATITTEAPPVYSVTVHGGTSDKASCAVGDTVTITATVPSGQRFTGWTVNEGGVTLADASSATTTFAMPDRPVIITANFQNNSSGNSSGGGSSYTPTYPPTVERPSKGGGAAVVSPSNPRPGDTVTIKPKPDEGYEVDEIIVTDKDSKRVEVTAEPDGTYTFKQPNGKVTIKVTYKPVDTPWNNPFADVSEARQTHSAQNSGDLYHRMRLRGALPITQESA